MRVCSETVAVDGDCCDALLSHCRVEGHACCDFFACYCTCCMLWRVSRPQPSYLSPKRLIFVDSPKKNKGTPTRWLRKHRSVIQRGFFDSKSVVAVEYQEEEIVYITEEKDLK